MSSHTKHQGAILKWWWIDRKRGAKPPFGLGNSEPLPEEREQRSA